jgi:5-methylcytosine-specific restriction endonuclease McrA
MTADALVQAWETVVGRYVPGFGGFPPYSIEGLELWGAEAANVYRRGKYQDYLETIWWSVIRSLALAAGYRQCEFCGATGRLHVHHLNYEHLGHETPSDLIVLCWSCHADAHEFPKRLEEIRQFAIVRDEARLGRMEDA